MEKHSSHFVYAEFAEVYGGVRAFLCQCLQVGRATRL